MVSIAQFFALVHGLIILFDNYRISIWWKKLEKLTMENRPQIDLGEGAGCW
jgi:hypothetical protein